MSHMVIKPYKTVIYSFFLGGLFALIAQAILAFWQVTLVDTPMSFFMGGATLVSLGIIGCILGGTGIYQILEKWATFGSLMPFSGFAMAVGMKAVGPWTKDNATPGRCVWNCVWFVVWFNVLFAAICIALGAACEALGFGEPTWVVEKVTDNTVFFHAFLIGGVLAVFFQCCYLIGSKYIKGCEPVHILMLAWMLGAIFAPCGLSGALSNWGGEGFAAMITVGGYNMYNVGVDLVAGETATALLHLGSFALAVCGLAITALFTWIIYNCLYGRTPISKVHHIRVTRMVSNIEKGLESAQAATEATDPDSEPIPNK